MHLNRLQTSYDMITYSFAKASKLKDNLNACCIEQDTAGKEQLQAGAKGMSRCEECKGVRRAKLCMKHMSRHKWAISQFL